VAGEGKVVHYDWDSGKILQTIALPEYGGGLVERDGELQVSSTASFITHINLANGEMRLENFQTSGAATVASAQNSGGTGNSATGGLPLTGTDNSKPLDPNTVAAQAQNLNVPAR